MVFFPHRHLIGIKGLTPPDITYLLDKADEAVKISRQREKKTSTLRGLTQINLFFEASTRTQSSFELAGKRLGADVIALPLIGKMPAASAMLFDLGVFALVVGATVLILIALAHQSIRVYRVKAPEAPTPETLVEEKN